LRRTALIYLLARIRNQQVVGSTPTGGSNEIKDFFDRTIRIPL
jgi:hypothetical protein